jgi:hypothetical protein
MPKARADDPNSNGETIPPTSTTALAGEENASARRQQQAIMNRRIVTAGWRMTADGCWLFIII